jgi:hypothetical protein
MVHSLIHSISMEFAAQAGEMAERGKKKPVVGRGNKHQDSFLERRA